MVFRFCRWMEVLLETPGRHRPMFHFTQQIMSQSMNRQNTILALGYIYTSSRRFAATEPLLLHTAVDLCTYQDNPAILLNTNSFLPGFGLCRYVLFVFQY